MFNGFLYSVERRYQSTVNWVCNKNSNSSLKCPARCVTSSDEKIKLGRKLHNHEPQYRTLEDGELDLCDDNFMKDLIGCVD